MASRIFAQVVYCDDPKLLADFWYQVLGLGVFEEEDGCVEIGPEEGFGGLRPTLIFGPTTEPKSSKLRLHIDVDAFGVDQDGDLERLLSLGARPADVGQAAEECVLQDSEGNELCLPRRRLS